MAFAKSGDVTIYFDTFGRASDPAVLLVSGLGSQCIGYEEEYCDMIASNGYFVIRFDNRDVGLSSRCDEATLNGAAGSGAASQANPSNSPYTLTDMANDGFSVLDELGVERAHVSGASMGGMIAQAMAIDHPQRLYSLTSIMSTTGDPDVGQSTPEAQHLLLSIVPSDLEGFIAMQLQAARTWGSPDGFDSNAVRSAAVRAFERTSEPAGFARQLKAIRLSGSRTEALRSLKVPTLVIHGSADTLVSPSGGERTAEVIPNARFVLIDGMGHDRPPMFWKQLVGLQVSHFQSC
jgi:pimeloyl-ACP methyl ester carboxylesterase